MASESLALVEEAAKELALYDGNSLKQVQEQQMMMRVKDLLERASKTLLGTGQDGLRLTERLTDAAW